MIQESGYTDWVIKAQNVSVMYSEPNLRASCPAFPSVFVVVFVSSDEPHFTLIFKMSQVQGPDDWGDIFLRNAGNQPQDYMPLYLSVNAVSILMWYMYYALLSQQSNVYLHILLRPQQESAEHQ